jgi:hypothetical protein
VKLLIPTRLVLVLGPILTFIMLPYGGVFVEALALLETLAYLIFPAHRKGFLLTAL